MVYFAQKSIRGSSAPRIEKTQPCDTYHRAQTRFKGHEHKWIQHTQGTTVLVTAVCALKLY